MDMQTVIVRAFRGQPLRRVTHECANGRVYVSSERAIRLAQSGALPAVGFPVEDTFVFDAEVFERLARAWSKDGETKPDDWRELKPLADAAPLIC